MHPYIRPPKAKYINAFDQAANKAFSSPVKHMYGRKTGSFDHISIEEAFDWFAEEVRNTAKLAGPIILLIDGAACHLRDDQFQRYSRLDIHVIKYGAYLTKYIAPPDAGPWHGQFKTRLRAALVEVGGSTQGDILLSFAGLAAAEAFTRKNAIAAFVSTGVGSSRAAVNKRKSIIAQLKQRDIVSRRHLESVAEARKRIESAGLQLEDKPRRRRVDIHHIHQYKRPSPQHVTQPRKERRVGGSSVHDP
jgi:hypothetical protein